MHVPPRNNSVSSELFATAIQYHQAGDFDRAEQVYRQIVDADPNEAEAWNHLGKLYRSRGRINEAILSYQRAIDASPRHTDALNGMGIAYAEQNRWDRAAASFRQVIRAQSGSAEIADDLPPAELSKLTDAERAYQLQAYNNLAIALFKLGKLSQAERVFQQVIRIKPDYAETLSNLGLVQVSLGLLPEAIASYQHALQVNPEFGPARDNLAQAMAAQYRQYQELLGLQAMSPVSDTAELYHELAIRLVGQRRLLEAVSAFQEALRLRHDYAEAHNNLGLVFPDLGNADEGIASLRRAVELDPGKVNYLNNLGTVLDAAHRHNDAIVCFEETLRRQPDFANAHFNLARTLCGLGKYTEGKVHYERALALEPRTNEATLAQLYEQACATPSDIYQHLPTLYNLARQCGHITEMGTRWAVSTTALLLAQPTKLICYDRFRFPEVDRLALLAGNTEFIFHQADVLQVEIEPTDMLFLDTWHVYDQLKEEFRLHSGRVRKYIVLHDTTAFSERGETDGYVGLWPAVEEFLALGTFRLRERYTNNNGLTILERCQ
jgi:tetratricopeptide (TPR) repeat protein